MQQKLKPCKGQCGDAYLYSGGYCLSCFKKAFPEKFQIKKSASPIQKKNSPLKHSTEKNKAKRAEERKDYPAFFQKHIEIMKEGKCCEECNVRLQPSIFSVCHILSKSKSPEVATNDDNIIYLCPDHHARFDSALSNREKMSCFFVAVEKYKLFKEDVVNYTKEVEQIERYLEL